MSNSAAALARLGDLIAEHVRDPIGAVAITQAAVDYARHRTVDRGVDKLLLWRSRRAAGDFLFHISTMANDCDIDIDAATSLLACINRHIDVMRAAVDAVERRLQEIGS